MTDAYQIARGIAKEYCPCAGDTACSLAEKIAAALREYGEFEYKRGFDQGYVYVDVKKADAAGYRRGYQEGQKFIQEMGFLKGSPLRRQREGGVR